MNASPYAATLSRRTALAVQFAPPTLRAVLSPVILPAPARPACPAHRQPLEPLGARPILSAEGRPAYCVAPLASLTLPESTR